jgi:hypothetical protein
MAEEAKGGLGNYPARGATASALLCLKLMFALRCQREFRPVASKRWSLAARPAGAHRRSSVCPRKSPATEEPKAGQRTNRGAGVPAPQLDSYSN